MHSRWFFERLGIAATSDAKQIKRAYARALKRIDQQTEREAFEALRAAYEEALAWAKGAEGEVPLQVRQARPAPHQEASEVPAGPQLPAARERDGPGGCGDKQLADGDADTETEADPCRVTGSRLDFAAAARIPGPPDTQALMQLAIDQWLAHLLDPQGMPLPHVLAQALGDPRLAHLDGRAQLEAALVDALYRKPMGQAELFELAMTRFGWAARRASPTRDSRQAAWVSQVIDQSLLWSSLDPRQIATYTAALDAALATDRPTPAQAWRHRAALNDLSHAFQAWSSLSLPPGRIDAWRVAYEALPAAYLRRVRVQRAVVAAAKWLWHAIKFTVGLFDNWASRALVAMMAFSVVVHFVAGEDTRTPAQRTSENVMRIAYANADRAPVPGPRGLGQDAPMPLDRLMGKIDRTSCAATHAMLHKREPRVFDDPPRIASLGAHAMLCMANNFWPQLTDPIVRCLETESWAANNQYRPQDNAHCAAAQAGK